MSTHEVVAAAPEAGGGTASALARGTAAGFGVSALLLVWAVVTLYWPSSTTGPDGKTVSCGSAAAALGTVGDACSVVTSQYRLQGLGLLAAAVVVMVTAFAVFGTRVVPARRPSA